jgi:hypothetical protein
MGLAVAIVARLLTDISHRWMQAATKDWNDASICLFIKSLYYIEEDLIVLLIK